MNITVMNGNVKTESNGRNKEISYKETPSKKLQNKPIITKKLKYI